MEKWASLATTIISLVSKVTIFQPKNIWNSSGTRQRDSKWYHSKTVKSVKAVSIQHTPHSSAYLYITAMHSSSSSSNNETVYASWCITHAQIITKTYASKHEWVKVQAIFLYFWKSLCLKSLFLVWLTSVLFCYSLRTRARTWLNPSHEPRGMGPRWCGSAKRVFVLLWCVCDGIACVRCRDSHPQAQESTRLRKGLFRHLMTAFVFRGYLGQGAACDAQNTFCVCFMILWVSMVRFCVWTSFFCDFLCSILTRGGLMR